MAVSSANRLRPAAGPDRGRGPGPARRGRRGLPRGRPGPRPASPRPSSTSPASRPRMLRAGRPAEAPSEVCAPSSASTVAAHPARAACQAMHPSEPGVPARRLRGRRRSASCSRRSRAGSRSASGPWPGPATATCTPSPPRAWAASPSSLGFALALFVASRLPTLRDSFEQRARDWTGSWSPAPSSARSACSTTSYELDSLTKLAGQVLATGLMVTLGGVQLGAIYVPWGDSGTFILGRDLGDPGHDPAHACSSSTR